MSSPRTLKQEVEAAALQILDRSECTEDWVSRRKLPGPELSSARKEAWVQVVKDEVTKNTKDFIHEKDFKRRKNLVFDKWRF